MRYDLRPDREGWTVYDIASERPARLNDLTPPGDVAIERPGRPHDLVLVGLDYADADELVGLLNRAGRPRRLKRLSQWPLLGGAPRATQER